MLCEPRTSFASDLHIYSQRTLLNCLIMVCIVYFSFQDGVRNPGHASSDEPLFMPEYGSMGMREITRLPNM